jgi:hypothetical protein
MANEHIILHTEVTAEMEGDPLMAHSFEKAPSTLSQSGSDLSISKFHFQVATPHKVGDGMGAYASYNVICKANAEGTSYFISFSFLFLSFSFFFFLFLSFSFFFFLFLSFSFFFFLFLSILLSIPQW